MFHVLLRHYVPLHTIILLATNAAPHMYDTSLVERFGGTKILPPLWRRSFADERSHYDCHDLAQVPVSVRSLSVFTKRSGHSLHRKDDCTGHLCSQGPRWPAACPPNYHAGCCGTQPFSRPSPPYHAAESPLLHAIRWKHETGQGATMHPRRTAARVRAFPCFLLPLLFLPMEHLARVAHLFLLACQHCL
jgi:hypothetical protein